MKVFLPLLIAIGMGIFAFTQMQKAEAVSSELAQAKEQHEFLQANHNTTLQESADRKRMLDDANRRITELENKVSEARSQANEIQSRLEESKRQVNSLMAGGDDLKKQLNDLLALRDKLAATESQLASAKGETTASEEKLATANAEIARLRAAAALPPMGSAMERKRQ